MKFKISLESFKSSLKIDLLFDNLSQGEFDVSWKVVVSSNSHSVPIEGDVSKIVVFAGKNHLDELLIGESSVSIAIKELDQSISFRLRNMVD